MQSRTVQLAHSAHLKQLGGAHRDLHVYHGFRVVQPVSVGNPPTVKAKAKLTECSPLASWFGKPHFVCANTDAQ